MASRLTDLMIDTISVVEVPAVQDSTIDTAKGTKGEPETPFSQALQELDRLKAAAIDDGDSERAEAIDAISEKLMKLEGAHEPIDGGDRETEAQDCPVCGERAIESCDECGYVLGSDDVAVHAQHLAERFEEAVRISEGRLTRRAIQKAEALVGAALEHLQAASRKKRKAKVKKAAEPETPAAPAPSDDDIVTLEDGRKFPKGPGGEPLSWSTASYNTLNEENAGFPRMRAVIRAMAKYRPDQLQREIRDLAKGSWDRAFGHNAQKSLKVIQDETGSVPAGARTWSSYDLKKAAEPFDDLPSLSDPEFSQGPAKPKGPSVEMTGSTPVLSGPQAGLNVTGGAVVQPGQPGGYVGIVDPDQFSAAAQFAAARGRGENPYGHEKGDGYKPPATYGDDFEGPVKPGTLYTNVPKAHSGEVFDTGIDGVFSSEPTSAGQKSKREEAKEKKAKANESIPEDHRPGATKPASDSQAEFEAKRGKFLDEFGKTILEPSTKLKREGKTLASWAALPAAAAMAVPAVGQELVGQLGDVVGATTPEEANDRRRGIAEEIAGFSRGVGEGVGKWGRYDAINQKKKKEEIAQIKADKQKRKTASAPVLGTTYQEAHDRLARAIAATVRKTMSAGVGR